MKLYAYLMFFLFPSFFCFAQSDSATVVNANWEVMSVTSGVQLKHCLFTDSSLFNSNQNISVLEIKQKRKIEFDLGVEAKLKKTTSDFGIENNAIAAINGTFFDVAKGGSVDYIRLNNKVINENRSEGYTGRARHQQAAVVIKKGKLSISQWDSTADWEQHLKGEDIMLSGPILLSDSREALEDTSSFSKSRHPRSLIAINRDKRVVLITIDGRNEKSAGMSLPEVTKIVRWMGCRSAINLDGGGSTTLWVKGQPENGVVNYPSDNKKWDHEGQRKVANVILVKKK